MFCIFKAKFERIEEQKIHWTEDLEQKKKKEKRKSTEMEFMDVVKENTQRIGVTEADEATLEKYYRQ